MPDQPANKFPQGQLRSPLQRELDNHKRITEDKISRLKDKIAQVNWDALVEADRIRAKYAKKKL